MADFDTPAQMAESIDQVSALVSSLTYEDVPPAVRRMAELCFLDTVGVTVAGMESETGKLAQAYARAVSPAGEEATVIGSGERASVPAAIFANGVAAHSLDFDDSTLVNPGHPSGVLVPAILALSETQAISGREAIAGYVAGYETMACVADPISPSHYERGWHSTATIGVFGAAAAAANVLGLDETRTKHAINLAASFASGVKQNFGTDAKPVHTGHASRSGTVAAVLADADFAASDRAVYGEHGFFDLYAGDEGVDEAEIRDADSAWGGLDYPVEYKKYPCCRAAHTTIAGTIDLCEVHGIDAEDVEAVHVETAAVAKDSLKYDRPETPLEAKFSMPFAVAAALRDGEITLATYADRDLVDEEISDLMDRVEFVVDESLPYFRLQSTVTLELASGETHTKTVERPPGTPENPMSDEEMRAKFRMCASQGVSESAAATLCEQFDSLRDVDDVASLVARVR